MNINVSSKSNILAETYITQCYIRLRYWVQIDFNDFSVKWMRKKVISVLVGERERDISLYGRLGAA